MKTSYLIIIVVITVSIISIFLYDSITLDRICQDDGGKRIGDTCKIPIIIHSTVSKDLSNVVKITTMKPNSMEWFYYPNSPEYEKLDNQIPRNVDTYRLFMLIRLPEWLGGNANDTSAFRAYSAKSIEDSCPVKYWPEQGRQNIANPCWGEWYRIIDGVMILGNTFRSSQIGALPHLDLSMDENGLLYIEPPKWSKTENGVIGYGKEITQQQVLKGSTFMRDSFKKAYPDFPDIPLEFAGHILVNITPNDNDVGILYSDLSSFSTITIHKPGSYGGPYLIYESFKYFETWHLGDYNISVGKAEYGKEPNTIRTYRLNFTKDGFTFQITGPDLELMKKEILRNYFPQYAIDDLPINLKSIS